MTWDVNSPPLHFYKLELTKCLTPCEFDHADLAEGARREAKWRQNGYTVISMKNDFKTIYGYGVQKTDFIFPEE